MATRLIPYTPHNERKTSMPVPPFWTSSHVLLRLVEMYMIERRLPRDDRRSNGSAWLFTTTHEFSEIVNWHDARERVWDSWTRARGVWPWEMSRAEEAAEWLSTILANHHGERRCLQLWAACRAYGRPSSDACRRKGWSRATFHRKINAGASRIALVLNAQRISVR